MKKSIFTFFVLAQFLNVQIQSAFGSQGLQQALAPEVNSRLTLIENRIANRLENLSEKAQLKLAYRLYKLDVRLRNKAHTLNDEQLNRAANGETLLQESLSKADEEIVSEAKDLSVIEDIGNEPLPELQKQPISGNEVKKQADPLLLQLGSSLDDQGFLSRASFEQFKDRIFGLQEKSLREPAGFGRFLVKVILSLLIIMMALSLLTAMLSYIIGYALIGLFFGGGWVFLFMAGIVVSLMFSVRIFIRVGSIRPLIIQQPLPA
ncbi:MAG: hypothetical protein KGP28_06685 [Bdellovibrionales bacterium]|nr:hypothetical protein [Bdellovibrionales bacterium]